MVGAVEEAGLAALGRPREGEGVALGRPKDGEGNLESEMAEGKLPMCSLCTGGKKWCKQEGSFRRYKSGNMSRNADATLLIWIRIKK